MWYIHVILALGVAEGRKIAKLESSLAYYREFWATRKDYIMKTCLGAKMLTKK